MPVVVIPGLSHMQFASGSPPINVRNNDLVSEISEAAAHKEISNVLNEFILNLE